jgi:hypothetical protein
MSDQQKDTKEPKKNPSNSGEWPGTRWPEPQPVQKLEPPLPLKDEDALKAGPTAAEDQDSTLNEGWKADEVKGSRPKRAEPKPRNP